MPARYRIIISPRAAHDLSNIHQYIEPDSPQNATAVVGRLVDAIDSLEHLPHRHPVHQGRRQPSQTVRRMPVPPFLIYYRVNDTNLSVGIVTVRHGSRRQPRRLP